MSAVIGYPHDTGREWSVCTLLPQSDQSTFRLSFSIVLSNEVYFTDMTADHTFREGLYSGTTIICLVGPGFSPACASAGHIRMNVYDRGASICIFGRASWM